MNQVELKQQKNSNKENLICKRKEFIKEKDMIGLFLSNCSALEIIDDTYRVIYGTPADKTFKPYAIKAYWQDGKYVEEILK